MKSYEFIVFLSVVDAESKEEAQDIANEAIENIQNSLSENGIPLMLELDQECVEEVEIDESDFICDDQLCEEHKKEKVKEDLAKQIMSGDLTDEQKKLLN
jgi:hypothetical protein